MSSDGPHEADETPDQAPVEAPDEASRPAPGDPRVDAAFRRAGELAATSPTEHVEIYEDVHRSLQEVLADASGQPDAPAHAPAPAPHESTGESAEAGDAVR
jgi:hypothetical protein